VHARIAQEAESAGTGLTGDDRRGTTRLAGIPLVVDDTLPAAPGYEIHRDVASGRPTAA
jgi:hypothetical protein